MNSVTSTHFILDQHTYISKHKKNSTKALLACHRESTDRTLGTPKLINNSTSR